MALPRKPYLIRAMHEWICDSEFTPHIVVDAEAEHVVVPAEHINDGKIILNISTRATEALQLGNEFISFATRFGGRSVSIEIPCAAVLGIYARETGEGMIFTGEDSPDDPDGSDEPTPPRATRPELKIVK
ncbi:MAG: ClpXP protease specificity-enhancing factor [Gammaproteobacteria bacterium]|nr:ClpXP protease specificity-enhancing factor [Gammaproteobacteria bacterium]NND59568.1 ClpXP protease specificity-enhancing factor [Gammaproteobacteria bacterium]